MNMPQQFINQLEKQLQDQLPGINAQRIMAPEVRMPEGFVPDRKNTKQSAVLIALYSTNNQITIPFIQRTNTGDAHSGQISFPGGKFELSDKSLETTALRETWEEIGIPPESVQVLGKISPLYIPVSNFQVHPFVGYIEERPPFRINPREVQELIEMPLQQLHYRETRRLKTITVRDFSFQAPYFEAKGHHIWGATAMMLSEFLEISKSVMQQ